MEKGFESFCRTENGGLLKFQIVSEYHKPYQTESKTHTQKIQDFCVQISFKDNFGN